MGEADAKALVFVAEHPGVRAADIAAHLGITAAGATALIDRLVERGVATREFADDDRRAIRIMPAVSLQEEPWSALCLFDDTFDRVVRSHTDERVQEFSELLDELTEAVSAP
jgi:DNA-binding MarR family transcriptional regulator